MTPIPKARTTEVLKNPLSTPMYRYQCEGALFAARAGRVLIGDDMGLGKTAQAIAATELLARHFGAERLLVVYPVSLKHQWQQEIARFVDREAQIINSRERHATRSIGTKPSASSPTTKRCAGI